MKYSGLIYFGMVLYVFFANVYLAHAQVTIEEKIYLEPESTSHSRDSIEIEQFDLPLSNSWYEYYEHFFFPQEPGELHISLARGFSQVREIDSTATLHITVKGKNQRRDTTIQVQPILGEPISGPRIEVNPTTWYFYGGDPFEFDFSAWAGDYANVRQYHKYLYDSETDNYDHVSTRTDENLSNISSFVAGVFHSYTRFPAPDGWGKYYYTQRSFFKYNLEPFQFPVSYVDSATITFMLFSRSPYRINPDGFNIIFSEVTQPWVQDQITWDNQPAVGRNVFNLPNPDIKFSSYAYDYHSLPITETIQKWLENPEKNHGLRIKLEDELENMDSGSQHISIPRGAYSPDLDIYFSNPNYLPETFSLNAGFVEPGDTVLISYDNGTERITNAYSNRIKTRTVGGKSYRGRIQEFQDRQRRDDGPIGRGNRPEQLFIFTYVKNADKEEIILGETRYYAAIEDPENPAGIQINRVNINPSGQPVMPPGMVEGAFEGEPVEILSGGKSGVYWERKWAHINTDGSISGGELPSGMIRLVGRYWEEDNDYRVKLNASSGSRSGELEVEVLKPDRLGNSKHMAKDVFDNPFNVDSLIIKHAGKHGIPPQWLKGQVQTESVTKDFGGEIGTGFAPAYRYEPFNWEFEVRTKVDVNQNSYTESPFWVTATSMGQNNPPLHQHTKYQSYYTSPMTIWDVVEEYSDLTEDKSLRLYARRDVEGSRKNQLNFAAFGYHNLQNIYDRIVVENIENFEGDSLYIVTRDSMATYLKTEWRGSEEIEDFEGGLENIYAQTRLASSYGLLQAWYVVATERGYEIKEENQPEKLNENGIVFPVYMSQHRRNLQSIVGASGLDGNNWEQGYDGVFQQLMQKWNPYKRNYSKTVLINQQDFMPLKPN